MSRPPPSGSCESARAVPVESSVEFIRLSCQFSVLTRIFTPVSPMHYVSDSIKGAIPKAWQGTHLPIIVTRFERGARTHPLSQDAQNGRRMQPKSSRALVGGDERQVGSPPSPPAAPHCILRPQKRSPFALELLEPLLYSRLFCHDRLPAGLQHPAISHGGSRTCR